ncbi:hypothetical protein [Salinicola endophyticus]|uniref:Uncharacterized protein n=1 Tax=Salinicola endophyticus TaxID=1949083 RepID=A0AB74UG31_9GAMM
MCWTTGISILAIVVSGVSAFMSIRTSRLSAKPVLSAWLQSDSPNEHAFIVSNKGNGPAIIESFEVESPGIEKSFEESGAGLVHRFHEVMRQAYSAHYYELLSSTYLPRGQAVGAGEEKKIVVFSTQSINPFDSRKKESFLRSWKVKIIYKDMFGNRKGAVFYQGRITVVRA